MPDVRLRVSATASACCRQSGPCSSRHWVVQGAPLGPKMDPALLAYETEGFELLSEAFVLVDVDTGGKLRFHGPFPLGDSEVSEAPKADPIPWAQIRKQHCSH